MAEVLGSAEVDVIYKSKQGQLRREIDSEVSAAEKTVPPISVGNVKTGATKQLRGEIDDLARSSRAGGQALSVLDNAAAEAGVSAAGLATGVAAVGAVLIGGIKLANEGIDAYIGLADSVRTVAERAGVTADEASRVVAVTDDYSISATTAANSLFFLGRAVSTNEEGLKKLGVVVERNRDGSTDLQGTLVNVADAYAHTADAGKRAELIQASLGRQGRELIPILEQGGQALRGMFEDVPQGQLLDERDLARAREYELAVDNLHDVWQEFTTEIGAEIVPALADLIDFLAEAARTVNDLAEPIGGLVGLLAAVDPTGVLKGAVAWKQYRDATDDAADSTSNLSGDLDDLANQVDDVYRRSLDLIDAESGQVRAQFALEDANDRVTDAQAKLNDAINRTGEFREKEAAAADKVRSAEQALTDARHREEQAQRARAKAADAVTEAEFRFGVQSREAKDARDKLSDAEFDVKDAHESVADAAEKAKDAHDDLTEAQRRGGIGSKEAAGAQRDLDRALQGQKDAARNAAEQTVKLWEATAAANGETLTAQQRVAIYKGKLDELAGTIAPGSPLRTYLQGLKVDIQGVADAERSLNENAPTPATIQALSPGAVGAGGLAGPGGTSFGAGSTGGATASDLGGGAAGVSSLSGGPVVQIDNLNVNNNVDAAMLPYDIAWQAGGGR